MEDYTLLDVRVRDNDDIKIGRIVVYVRNDVEYQIRKFFRKWDGCNLPARSDDGRKKEVTC